ncbi:MAG: hypothetical protein QM758_16800 [Armatimonas sp.]
MSYRTVLIFSLLLVCPGVGGVAQARQRAELSPVVGKATLPSGTTVEVLGITENPGPASLWWAADGKSLKRPPVSLAARTPGSRVSGVRALAFVVRLNPPGAIKLVTAAFDGGKRLSPQAFAVTDLRRKDGTWLVSFSAPEGAKTANFQLGVPLAATGQVETAELRAIALRAQNTSPPSPLP